MAFTTAPDHAGELVASMTIEQLVILQTMSRDELTAIQSAAGPQLHRLLLPTKTFAVPELLEQILSLLDFAEIFTIMRVSRTFFTTIIGSITLQRDKLWMQPTEGLGTIPLPLQRQEHFRDKNPFVHQVLLSLGWRVFVSRFSMPDEVDLQPWLPRRPTLKLMIMGNGDHRTIPARYKGLKDAEEASWRRMYVTAFPLRLQLTFLCSAKFDISGSGCHTRELRLEADDATVGAVYDATIKAEAEFAKCEAESTPAYKRQMKANRFALTVHRCRASL